MNSLALNGNKKSDDDNFDESMNKIDNVNEYERGRIEGKDY